MDEYYRKNREKISKKKAEYNLKNKVDLAEVTVARVLSELKHVFPYEKGNSRRILKIHEVRKW